MRLLDVIQRSWHKVRERERLEFKSSDDPWSVADIVVAWTPVVFALAVLFFLVWSAT